MTVHVVVAGGCVTSDGTCSSSWWTRVTVHVVVAGGCVTSDGTCSSSWWLCHE